MVADQDDEDVVIDAKELTFLKVSEDMPYLKQIQLVRLNPQQFDLPRWESQLTIPNHWMQKLYKNDAYFDTEDFVRAESPERLDDRQRRVLNNYLEKNRKFDDIASCKARNCRTNKLPLDDLFEVLEAHDKKLDATLAIPHPPLSEFKSNIDIAICREHKVQSEDNIVLRALDKMKSLSVEDEALYQNLLRDKDFMKFLNNQIESYIKKASAPNDHN